MVLLREPPTYCPRSPGVALDRVRHGGPRFALHYPNCDQEYPAGGGKPVVFSPPTRHLIESSMMGTNFLSFLSGKIVSVAVPHLPWLGSNGKLLAGI